MNIIHKAAPIALILILAVLVSGTILKATSGILTPYLHKYGENTVLVNAWGITAGHGLYRLSEVKQVPVFAATYPPLLYLLVAAGIKIWGISYIPGRLLAFLAMLASGLLIGGIARRQGSSNKVAVIVALAFLGTFPVYNWSGILRVDFLALFFELAAVFVFLGKESSIKRSTIFIVLALIAGYSKQSAFGLVGGVLLGTILAGDMSERKRAVIIGCVYALSAFLLFLLLDRITGGGFRYFVIGSFRKKLVWASIQAQLQALFFDPWTAAAVILGVAGAVGSEKPLWWVAFLAAPFALAFRTVGVHGAGLNHFIEPLAACSLGMAYILNSNENSVSIRSKWIMTVTYAMLLICVGWSTFLMMPDMKKMLKTVGQFRSTANYNPAELFMKQNLSPGSYVLAEYSDLPLFADCVPVMSDPFILNTMAEDGKWDPAPVIAALKARKIPLVIFGEKINSKQPMDFLPRKAAEEIEKNYEFVTSYGYVAIYAPK